MIVVLDGGGRVAVVGVWWWAVQVGIVSISDGMAWVGLVGDSGFADVDGVAG